jgi:hypothetical protein
MGSSANCLPARFVESGLPLNLLSFFSGKSNKAIPFSVQVMVYGIIAT